MESARGSEQLLAGTRAMERADWTAARAAFETVLETEDSPEALDGLGQALWFLGLVAEGIAAREQAFEGYVRARDCDGAARMAVWVSHQHLIAGRGSAARSVVPSERWRTPARGVRAVGGSRWSVRDTPRAPRTRSRTRAVRCRSPGSAARAISRCSRSACWAARW